MTERRWHGPVTDE